jgi:FSR family fosmidomycin resistance protein-like MFS transporter
MAVFSVGGNLGVGLGPLCASYFYARAGSAGSLWFILPAGIASLVLCLLLPKITAIAREYASRTPSYPAITAISVAGQEFSLPLTAGHTGRPAASSARVNRAVPYGYFPVVILVSIVILRSWVHAGLTNYIPLYYISYLGGDQAHVRNLQAVFLLSGAIGTLVGSPLADRWGLKTLITLSMAAQVPLIYFFPYLQGPWLYAILAASGFLVISTFASTVVFGQELLPRHVGLASGLMLGLGIGTGGLGVTLMGAVADTWGVPAALSLLGFLPAIAVVLTFFLPRLADAREGGSSEHL